MIKACMIDMDGTLLDSMPYWQAAERRLLAALGATVPAHLRERLCMYADQPWMCETTQQDAEAIWAALTRDVLPFFETEIPLKRGASAFLDALSDKGITAWLVTGSPRLLAQIALSRCGVAGSFASILSTKDLPLGKHSPAFFEWMAAELGISPDEILVVEDDPAIARCAGEAGCTVYGIEEPVWPSHDGLRRACHRTTVDFIPLVSRINAEQ